MPIHRPPQYRATPRPPTSQLEPKKNINKRSVARTTDAGDTFNTKWTGLNEHLIAKFFPVDSHGNALAGSNEVHAPLLNDAEIEYTSNWQSPMENSGIESVSPTMGAMLQSGAIQPIVNALEGLATQYLPSDSANWIKENITSNTSDALRHGQGRTGMTKLNSTQIFTGAMPIRFSLTLVFRAYSDPMNEVERPKDQLWEWSLPQYLQANGVLAEMADFDPTLEGVISAAFPSKVPQLIGFTYKGKTYAPLVIESISEPLGSPINEDGKYTSLLLPISIASLTAWDKGDWSDLSVNS